MDYRHEPAKRRDRWKGFASRPHGLLLLGLRLPIWLYRARLGWLLGDRFLLLTHVGRKTGRSHRTVLEVVGEDQGQGIWYVAAGWGKRSDWYRNVQENHSVELTVGARTAAFRAEIQSKERAAEVFLDYARRHPLAFKELAGLIAGREADSVEGMCTRMAQEVPVVAFHPATESSIDPAGA
jgi:deazaflavin-dependent oxidoreductase (nitroreductase family)